MTIRSISRGLLVLVLLCTAAATADANTRRARTYYKKAEKLFAKQKYGPALKLYRKAYAAKPLAGFHFNMGLCLHKLGRHNEAVAQFKMYLRLTKSTRNKARATELLRRSETAAKSVAKPQAKPDPHPPPEMPPVATKPPVAKKPARNYRRLRPLYFWLAAGTATTLIVAGTVTGIVALAKDSSFNDPDTPKSELKSLQDVGQAMKTTSTITWTVGAVAATATVVLYFLTDFGKETRVGAAPLRDGGAIFTLAGQF